MTTYENPIEVVPARDRGAIEEWLVDKMASIANLSRDEVDVGRPFADFQLDSSVAVSVTNQLSVWLDRELPITLFWEYPTIAVLAGALPGLALPLREATHQPSASRLGQ
ncbi:acyl carrier protein [Pendulispora albinea]|uniref:Acyl carrier protein n=1 Tax=Pendulispora albinea TaxID=2741071 RepID=A0ABZ2LLL7_9BACT